MCQVPAIPESVSFRVSSSPTFLRLSSITGLCRPRIRTSPDTVPGVLPIPGCGGPALAVCCCRRSGLGLFLAGTFCKSEGCSMQASLSLLIEAFLPSLSLSYANGSSPTAPRFSVTCALKSDPWLCSDPGGLDPEDLAHPPLLPC